MKAALGLLGTGQLSLTKCLVLVSEEIDPRDWRKVLGAIREHFDPAWDFVLIPKVPLDTLDFTSFTMELGSKMILDATRKERPQRARRQTRVDGKRLRMMDRRIVDAHGVEETLLLVKTRESGRAVIEKLVQKNELQHFKMIAAVSEDVNIRDQENSIWGVFTRFDCERDLVFSQQKLMGISPIYRGVMGIDATWKRGYPSPLVMDDRIVKKVDERWDQYWK